MAKKFDLDGTPVETVTPNAPVQTEAPNVEAPFVNVDDPEDAVHGLNQEEIKDPNSIVVSIADQAVPIIVLFGPTECNPYDKVLAEIRLPRIAYTLFQTICRRSLCSDV